MPAIDTEAGEESDRSDADPGAARLLVLGLLLEIDRAFFIGDEPLVAQGADAAALIAFARRAVVQIAIARLGL